MSEIKCNNLRQQLLTPSSTFNREDYKAFLYTPYSRKLFRKVYVHTHLGYDLWARVEADKSVAKYNERPTQIEVAVNQEVVRLTPALATSHRDGTWALHFIWRDTDDCVDYHENFHRRFNEEERASIQQWSELNGCMLEIWNAKTLRQYPVRLSNLKLLLRYVCNTRKPISPKIKERLRTILKATRSCTVLHLTETACDFDSSFVEQAIAEMILDEEVFSDIDIYPFHYSSELSIHHEINQLR